jgi:hypothetical protein
MAMGRGTLWDWLTGVAGLVLVVSLLLEWYYANQEYETAASTLGLLGKLLFLVGFAAMAAPFVATLRPSRGRAQSYSMIMVVIGSLATLYIAIRLADPPEINTLEQEPVTLEPAAWVGLASAVGIIVFSALAMWTRQSARPARSGA